VTLALPLWTLFVWLTRVRNVVRDDGLGIGLVVPVALCALAAVALVDRRRGVPLLAALTVGVWLIRLPFVLAHEHSAAFKVVHTALAVVSIGLAALSVRAVRARDAVSSRR
jgi:hypothetical protein